MADNNLEKNHQTAWWQPALVVFAKLSGWIGLPIIIALFLGRWLDNKYNSSPWLLLGSIGLAFTLSMAGLIKETINEYKKIDRLSKGEKSKQKKY